jgi:hypothetical protein
VIIGRFAGNAGRQPCANGSSSEGAHLKAWQVKDWLDVILFPRTCLSCGRLVREFAKGVRGKRMFHETCWKRQQNAIVYIFAHQRMSGFMKEKGFAK